MGNRSGLVSRKGQVTIPADLRRQFNIKEGDAIAFHVIDGHLVLERGEDIALRTAGILSQWAIHPPRRLKSCAKWPNRLGPMRRSNG